MILREAYIGFPGHCGLCTSAEVPVIDTERPYDHFDGHGIFYVCVNCAGTLAQMLGWISPERATQIEADRDNLIEQVNALEVSNEKLNVLVDTLTADDVRQARANRPRRGKV